MAKGEVARPATRLTAIMARVQSRRRWGAAMYQGRPLTGAGRGQASARATRAAVAQNDISNPGETTTSGWSASKVRAARARECRLSARRSQRMATKAAPAVIAARRAGGWAPLRAR